MAISVIAGDTLVIVVSSKSVKDFKQMVHRATNLWPDAPPEIKELADLITVGYIQQNYHVQDTSKKKVA